MAYKRGYGERGYYRPRKGIKRKWRVGYRKPTGGQKRLRKFIRATLAAENEKKQASNIFAEEEATAAGVLTAQLTDVISGSNNNERVGNEVTGSHFDILLNLFNKTNNDLFVRVALIEQEGRGATVDIDPDTTMLLGPNGNVVSYNAATTIAENAAVMWQYDTKGSVNILREKVYKLGKYNSGNESSSRACKWIVPWTKRIRYASPSEQGALLQSKRVTLVLTAWSPAGGDQSTYTYAVDGCMKYYYRDS